MEPFIVIRPYRNQDELKCQELLQAYIMSFVYKSFYRLCFREITVQLIVITWALLFIFFGVSLTYCSLTIPGWLIILFCSNYLSFYMKALELMNTKPIQSIVAECYEPFLFRLRPTEVNYQIFLYTPPYESSDLMKLRKKIVATISLKNHCVINTAAYMYRFAIAPEYHLQNLVDALFSEVMKNCLHLGYYTLEATVSEFQEYERNIYDNIGFTTRQIYHKQIVGNHLTIVRIQLQYTLPS